MDFKQIQTLIKEFEKSSMTVLELEHDNFKIKLSKNKEGTTIIEQPTIHKGEQTISPVEEEKGFVVKSPLVGTYYAASSPKDKPFVNVGDRVQVGDTLCIIEAMKIMNEITAPISGIIDSIKVANATAVGYEQVLMVIR